MTFNPDYFMIPLTIEEAAIVSMCQLCENMEIFYKNLVSNIVIIQCCKQNLQIFLQKLDHPEFQNITLIKNLKTKLENYIIIKTYLG